MESNSADGRREFWKGIPDWYGFKVSGSIPWSQGRKKEIVRNLQIWQMHLEDNDPLYFTHRLPPKLHRQMPIPAVPVNPVIPDRETMERLRCEKIFY